MRWGRLAIVLLVGCILIALLPPRIPSVVSCDRYGPNLKVTVESTRRQGFIERRELWGTCVLYYHGSRDGGGD
jgi:hypothetical protein